MDVAILVTLFDESLQYIPACLESLDRTLPPRWRGEVILVDNTTARQSPALPRPDWLIRPPDAPLGLAAARNAAATATRARTLCFVDPGVVLLPGWLPPMRRVLERAPRAGVVGCVHREPATGLIDHAGMRFHSDGFPVPASNPARLPTDPFDRWPVVSLACALVRRSVFDLAGGFNERYRGRLGDADFCLRAAQAGARLYVSNRSVIYHHAQPPVGLDDANPDAHFFRLRWADRAAAALRRRGALRDLGGQPADPEAWEMAREARRLERLRLRETRLLGTAYLKKHLHRPWRYNYGRLCRALGQVLEPAPRPLPPAHGEPDDARRADDGWLFDPPPR